jgi:DNA-directed RNA polymerase subunit RPC12/RpoP
MRHHKVGCGGQLEHREDKTTDYYRCTQCGTRWQKNKRQAKEKKQ